MTATIVLTTERDLARRIEAEYREMPGLSLTLLQASRLWHVDRFRCADVLEHLAQRGFLQRVGEIYVRAEGRV